MVKGALHTDSLQGKTIVVTGGGTGLGKAMSTYFSSLGANLVISSRKLDVLTGTAAEISKQTGNPVLPVACDVRNEDDIQKMLQAAEEKFGQVDILVNNAAGNFISPTERLSANAFSTIIDIVLKGTVNCTLAFGKNWIAKKTTGFGLEYRHDLRFYRLRLCRSICRRQSGSRHPHQIACCRMGKIWHPSQCNCSWPFPNKRGMGQTATWRSHGKI